jgi:hypothetical protein
MNRVACLPACLVTALLSSQLAARSCTRNGVVTRQSLKTQKGKREIGSTQQAIRSGCQFRSQF